LGFGTYYSFSPHLPITPSPYFSFHCALFTKNQYIDNELRYGKVTPQNFFAFDGAEWYHGSDRPPQRTARFLPWQ
jgi:hypothetical protein